MGARGRETGTGLGHALVADAQTQQTQPSCITHPCEISCSGRDGPDPEHTAVSRARQQQQVVQHMPMPRQVSSTARLGQKDINILSFYLLSSHN